MSNLQEQIYIDFLNYDWDSFSEFQEGLKEILESYLDNLKEQDPSVTLIPAVHQQQLIEQAKSFFYCNHTGEILNLDDYLQWKSVNGYKYDKSRKISEITDGDITVDVDVCGAGPVSNEVQVPEIVQVDSSTPATHALNSNSQLDSTNSTNEPQIASITELPKKVEDPPYSTSYQDLVHLIVSGQPVPGIKTIPDTVVPEKSSKSEAAQRLKPWERRESDTASEASTMLN